MRGIFAFRFKKYHAGVSEIHDLFLLHKLHVKHDLVAWDFNDL